MWPDWLTKLAAPTNISPVCCAILSVTTLDLTPVHAGVLGCQSAQGSLSPTALKGYMFLLLVSKKHQDSQQADSQLPSRM